MRGNQGAAGQQLNFVVNIWGPPGVASGVDLERQACKILKAVARADFFDADGLSAQLTSPKDHFAQCGSVGSARGFGSAPETTEQGPIGPAVSGGIFGPHVVKRNRRATANRLGPDRPVTPRRRESAVRNYRCCCHPE